MGVKFFAEYPSQAVPNWIFEKVTPHIWKIEAHYVPTTAMNGFGSQSELVRAHGLRYAPYCA